MAHEMIEEGKLLKMIYSVLHDSLLATATGNSATSPDNSTTIDRTATEIIGTPPTQYIPSNAKTTGDRQQSKRPSESQLQGDLNREKTYDFEIEIPKPPNSPVNKLNTYLTDLDHKQQKSPNTEITAPQQGGLTHHIPKEPSATTGERQLTRPLHVILERNPKRARESDGKFEEPKSTAAPQGHNPDVGGGGAALTRTTTSPQGHLDTWPKDASTRRPDIRRCIQVGSDTFVLRTEPGTTLGQRPQPVEDVPEPDPTGDYHGAQSTVERRERKKKKSGHTHRTHEPNNRATCRHDTHP
jgi:hypothetical protein